MFRLNSCGLHFGRKRVLRRVGASVETRGACVPLQSYTNSPTDIWVELPRSFVNVDVHRRDRLSGPVVTVPAYRYRGPGFDSRRYQAF
jgi:hypothetical protein